MDLSDRARPGKCARQHRDDERSDAWAVGGTRRRGRDAVRPGRRVLRVAHGHRRDGHVAGARCDLDALRPEAGVGSPIRFKWVAALGAMVCVYNLPQLLSGSVQFDGLDVHYSAQRYLSDELHAGRLPFWTPYIFSGFPFLADLQVGAWYPLNWPFFAAGIFLSTQRSIGLQLLLHNLIACGGTYALANRLIGRPAPAVAAALFYG